MVADAALPLREYGASATSIDRVLAHSGTLRGSVYHHFPDGRTQLIREAVRFAGDYISGLIDEMVRTDDPLCASASPLTRKRSLVQSQYRPLVLIAGQRL
jgi:AcrR family transcriptional regulator